MLIHESAEDVAARTDPARAPAYWGAWKAYVDALGASGLVRGGAGLDLPATARLVRGRSGATQVVDGPYPEAREQLGGFFLLEVEEIGTAQEWAARCPAAATGTVELRPTLAMLG
ncbi:YciI family protein [Falsiroseomonas oryzae]|uniref:YciI family protein n=1 Tax=Falsiroseomonas oryzae TaxID=2766473 RepID=UPI0022EADA8E|nr:YciI family protein [Roseomonas sp. MO-31]